MELSMIQGDYVPDGIGGFRRLEGAQALLQRVLFRLTARRGSFPFLPEMGSGLHRVLREKPSARKSAATQYVVEALEGEDVEVTQTELEETDGQMSLRVWLRWQGEEFSLSVGL